MKKLSLILAASALLLPGLATAGSVTVNSTNTIGQTPTNWGPMALTFNKFNPALGSLNSVVLTLNGSMVSSVGFWNMGEAPDDISTTLQADLTAAFDSGYCSVDCSVTVSPSLSFTDNGVDPFAGEFSLFSPQFGHTGNKSDSGSTLQLTEGSLLAALLGPGTFTIDVNANAASNATGGGNVFYLQNTSAGAYGSITYNYTDAQAPDAPEPASMVLLGSALAGLALARRKFRS